ncbi:MAG: signal recognition particle-docking protein FtsY [Planctomycetes bacterium]|nr:signal recognition particle-docking protein FtsY [Planctomycetota bacterium]
MAIMPFGRQLDAELIDEMEDYLYSADIGPQTVGVIMDRVREAHKSKTITTTDECYTYLKDLLKEIMKGGHSGMKRAESGPTVILVAGVNGSGKTTSIAKLCRYFGQDGKKVMLAAADTFRAAAVEQLTIWADRLGADIIKKQQGSDPASVAFDACEAARARGVDVLIIDTAGRLQTQKNLMQELEKIKRVIGKKIEGAPHEVLLILDANNGQNAIAQAEEFGKALEVTGLFLTKLDGTAKGGAVIGIRHQIDVPVRFIGVGEKAEDMEEFDADTFVEALFS